jgi:Tfp pilus assembly protein PilV
MNTAKNYMTHSPRNAGFSLLEVMAICLLALASLQGKLTRYGTVAKQRTLAVNLAEEQLEVIRSFGTVPSTGTADCATVAGSYDDIGTCADGVTTYVGELAFDTTWTVESYTQNADGTHTDWDTDSSIRADFKTVTITVSWVDGLGESQSIQLSDMVDATAPFNTGKLVTQETDGETPIVKFNIDDFPGVVEIALGDDKIKGSTTPQPEIKNSGNNVETTFDVVTFVRQGEGDTFLQRREEFKIVSCVCNLDAGLSMGNQPIYWDGEEYA